MLKLVQELSFSRFTGNFVPRTSCHADRILEKQQVNGLKKKKKNLQESFYFKLEVFGLQPMQKEIQFELP